ncbi:MAG: hypothetical protein JWP02_2634 [Acidimicrobiales bacterium]|nr:hypothetical protein [Acidimicrobiales bacterium]
MANWVTISQFATAAGTLVLAGATFAAVRSANTAARTAERSLMTALRPLLIPSRPNDPPMKVLWSDSHFIRLDGAHAHVEATDDVIYLAMSVRNAGNGIAVLHGWYPLPDEVFRNPAHADPAEFRRLSIDLYVSAGDPGYWESAVRGRDDPAWDGLAKAIAERRTFGIEVLYGDQEGGQRVISRFLIVPAGESDWYTQTGRHWNMDRPDPR